MAESGEEQAARDYLKLLLRYRPRSRHEAATRLRERGFPDEVIKKTLAWAEANGLLDDRAFAKLWLLDRLSRKPRGRALLERELRAKGLSEEVIAEALAELEIDELALARRVLNENFMRYRCRPPEVRRRLLLALLRRRGFPPEVAYRAVRELDGDRDLHPPP